MLISWEGKKAHVSRATFGDHFPFECPSMLCALSFGEICRYSSKSFMFRCFGWWPHWHVKVQRVTFDEMFFAWLGVEASHINPCALGTIFLTCVWLNWFHPTAPRLEVVYQSVERSLYLVITPGPKRAGPKEVMFTGMSTHKNEQNIALLQRIMARGKTNCTSAWITSWSLSRYDMKNTDSIANNELLDKVSPSSP